MHAVGVQPPALLGGDGGGDPDALGGIVVEAVELRGHPVGYAGAAAVAEALDLGEVVHRQDAGRQGTPMPAAATRSRKRRTGRGRKEELGDRADRAGIELALQIVEVGSALGASGWVSG